MWKKIFRAVISPARVAESAPLIPPTEFHVYRVILPDGLHDVVSLLPEEPVFRLGLTRQAVVGVIVNSERELTLDNFRPNSAFVDLLHSTIATYGPELESLREAARHQGTGWLYVIDGRTPTPAGEVPPHDICGRFEVKDGAVVQGSYERSCAY